MRISNGKEEVKITTPQKGEITISADPEGDFLKVELLIDGNKKFYRITQTNPPPETGRRPGLIMQGF